MTGFEIRPDSLRGSAEGIDQSVDRLAEAIEQFEARLQAFGDPWGGDEIGSLIGELYGLIHDMALTCFESNGEVLGEYADGLHVMADGLDQTETDIAGGLQQIHQALGG